MGYTLRPGLSFCEIEQTVIFLDVVADRYFCLGEQASAAFLELVRDPSIEVGSDWPAIGLVVGGMLIDSTRRIAPVPCNAAPATETLLDVEDRRAQPGDTLEALARRMTAEFNLRRSGLAAQVARARRYETLTHCGSDLANRASRAFAAAALWRSRQQRCLSISFATAGWFARRGCRAELVFGVRLHPFQAHCWVQCDGLLINDPVDAVGNFTPILAL